MLMVKQKQLMLKLKIFNSTIFLKNMPIGTSKTALVYAVKKIQLDCQSKNKKKVLVYGYYNF